MGQFWSSASNLFGLKRKEFIPWSDREVKDIIKQLKVSEDRKQLMNRDFIAMKDNQEMNALEVLNKWDECVKEDKKCEPMLSYEDENKWYLPKCNRINAQKLLKGRKNGTFLVRTSDNLKGKYILSIVIKGHIKHIVIQKHEDGYSLYGEERHPTLYSLVMFYAQPFEQESDTTNDVFKNLNFPVFQ